MQQFNQSSTTTKVIVIGLIVAVMLAVCVCVLGAAAWFYFSSTDVAGPAATASPIPVQLTATPTPVTFTGWRGEYFNNPNLEGEPVLVRDDEQIKFDWTNSSPAPEVPAQNFSVRWTISRDVPAGIYRFTGNFDNGVRLWVDDELIADEWVTGPVRSGSVDVNLTAGTHTARFEYFHTSGPATVQLRADYLETFPDWKAEYFDQPNFNSPPVLVRNELEINQNWGATSPVPGTIPDNNYAVRWSRTSEFNSGNYIFRAEVEGGIRVWLNGEIFIDSWGESALRQVEEVTSLNSGPHGLVVEYWKQSGNGQIRFGWAKLEDPGEAPVAVINGSSNAVVGQTVSFNARSSRLAEGSQAAALDWDFGDGNKASGLDVTHVYNSPGVFGVSLTVVDDKGLNDTTVHQITINDQPATPQPDQPPLPVIDGTSKAQVGDNVVFDSSRTVSANPIVRNAWEFGDGTRIDNAVKVQHVYSAPGTYRVKLTVEDNKGLKSVAYHQITISDVAPQPTPPPDQPPLARINAPASVEVGEPFIVAAVDSQCATNCVSYAWDMGDGTQANAVTFQHVYQTPGDFNIVLTVTDDKGLEGTANQVVSVTTSGPAQPPSAVINGPNLAEVGEMLTFDGAGSQPGSGGPIVDYSWDFGEGGQANGATVTYTYLEPGSFMVRLTVTDEQGSSGDSEWPIQITPVEVPEEQLQPEQLPEPPPEEGGDNSQGQEQGG